MSTFNQKISEWIGREMGVGLKAEETEKLVVIMNKIAVKEDIYDEELAKTQFLDQFENLFKANFGFKLNLAKPAQNILFVGSYSADFIFSPSLE